MEALVQPEKLRTRIKLWANEEIASDSLPKQTGTVLEAICSAASCRAAMCRN